MQAQWMIEGFYHFNYKYDGFYNKNVSLESNGTKVLC